jgi:hypothetical protein
MKSLIKAAFIGLVFILSGCGSSTFSTYTYEDVEVNSIDSFESNFINSISGNNIYFLRYDTNITNPLIIALPKTMNVKLYGVISPEASNEDFIEAQANACSGGDISLIHELGFQTNEYIESIMNKNESYQVDLIAYDIADNFVSIVRYENEALNIKLVEEGYAVPYGIDINQESSFNVLMKVALNKAKMNETGLWAEYPDIMDCISGVSYISMTEKHPFRL